MAKRKLSEPMFDVWNNTDGIYASLESMTEAEADQFIAHFPKRYEAQGYYRNNRMEKMDPKDVKLIKLPSGDQKAFSAMLTGKQEWNRNADVDPDSEHDVYYDNADDFDISSE